ncbi:FmdB family zinc ribbon protein [Piscinibacter sakaiensis]|uniref:FmdB family zinc ribbon protein n=1 Tax=Piscinibacter sakaiensis TaxID=1547922 RepID=UPI003AAB6887
MPIYAYRCATCGHAKDVLQKVSDPVLSTCPACGAETFSKQVTAAGFQLKGSGWYVTDFRGDNASKKSANNGEADAVGTPKGDGKTDSAAPTKATGESSPSATPAPAAAPAAAPAGPSAPASPPAAKS